MEVVPNSNTRAFDSIGGFGAKSLVRHGICSFFQSDYQLEWLQHLSDEHWQGLGGVHRMGSIVRKRERESVCVCA